MKKQKQGRLLCALCLALLLIPLAGMLLAGPSDAVSNERLAAKPRLMRGGKLNPDFLSETADYFAGHFYLRPALLTANSTVQAAVFRESASEDVVLGDGGWLFYADTLEDFQGTNPMTGRALFCAARNLALLQEYCAQQGTKFLFVCAPNKNTSYPEYMPGQYRKTEQVSDLDRLEQALTQQGVSFCDLREALSGRESLTYYRTDSHWNGYGSYLAGRQILQALGKEADTEDVSRSMQQHAGDLYGMLYPASDRKEDAPAPAQLRTFSYLGDVRGADDQLIRTQSGAEGTLFMFRDSFGNALHADLAGQFSQAVFSRSMPYDLSQAEEMPEVLIAEIAQRNLRWLAQRPPLLPAPQRQAPVWEREAQQKLSVSVSESGFEGLFCYEGRFPEPPDTDAAVFACVDGVWYESCLTEDGFRLLAPEAESVQLVTTAAESASIYQAELTNEGVSENSQRTRTAGLFAVRRVIFP